MNATFPLTTLAQTDAPGEAGVASRSLLDLVLAGGPVGFVLIGLSLVGLALVIHSAVRLRARELVPPALADEVVSLARKRRFEEVLSLTRTSDTLLGRVVAAGMSEGTLGLDAVREGLQQRGEREFTRLRQFNGYLGLIAAVAPMLGLLGTVTGMISSFELLGERQGTARPDELAVGISQALVTTCMGLILAVPLTFFYAFFRDRIQRIAQETSAVGERLLRAMSVSMAPAPAPGRAPAKPAARSAPVERSS